MNSSLASKALEPEPMKSDKNGITCKQCRDGLADFIEGVLDEGNLSATHPVILHVERCSRCAQAYLQLMDLVTAPYVKALQEALIDPARAPENLAGLLVLWQKQLAICDRLEDLRGAAVGLSVTGMVRRQLGEMEEARLIHELALQTAEESRDLLSRMISSTDLGYIALHSNQVQEAKIYLEAAQNYAVQLQDGDSAIRVRLLLSRIRGMKWQALQEVYHEILERAKIDYEAALRWYEEMLESVLKPNLLGQKFMAGLLGPPLFLAASAGERALVINTVSEIPIEIVDPNTGDLLTGFKLDVAGRVTFGLRLTSFPTPQTFYIDVLFVPTGAVICHQTVGPQERVLLTAMQGLKFDCDLFLSDEFMKEWQQRLQLAGWKSMLLPKTAFALRVWWD